MWLSCKPGTSFKVSAPILQGSFNKAWSPSIVTLPCWRLRTLDGITRCCLSTGCDFSCTSSSWIDHQRSRLPKQNWLGQHPRRISEPWVAGACISGHAPFYLILCGHSEHPAVSAKPWLVFMTILMPHGLIGMSFSTQRNPPHSQYPFDPPSLRRSRQHYHSRPHLLWFDDRHLRERPLSKLLDGNAATHREWLCMVKIYWCISSRGTIQMTMTSFFAWLYNWGGLF